MRRRECLHASAASAGDFQGLVQLGAGIFHSTSLVIVRKRPAGKVLKHLSASSEEELKAGGRLTVVSDLHLAWAGFR